MSTEGHAHGPTFGGGAGPLLEGYAEFSIVGRGGFAVVYRAWQAAFNRVVAVKVLSHQALDARSYRLFDRERVALGALSSHPNIVTVYDSGVTGDGAPFLVMEYVPRGSLADRVDAGPTDWREAIRVGVKLAGALETAHRAGVLHRDIKPENVLVSAFGEPQLADFGIARLLGSPQTRSLEVKLSVPFAPPELLDGAEPSVRSDVYSLACTLHSLVLGRPSFLSEHPDQNSLLPLMGRIRGQPPPDLRPLGVPDEVCSVLEAAMAKDPAQRHATVWDFGTDLQAAERAAGAPATPLPVAAAVDAPHEDDGDPGSGGPRRHAATTLRTGALPAGSGRLERRPRRRFLAPVAAVAVAALGVATVSSLSHPRSGVTTTATTATSGPTTSLPPVPLPAHTAPLPAQSYIVAEFRPQMVFSLEEGWRRLRTDRADLIELVRTDRPEHNLVSVLTLDQVVDPQRSFSSLGDARRPSAVLPRPADIVEWLRRHPGLVADSAVDIKARDIAGRRVDVEVRTPNTVCARGRPCLALFPLGRTLFVLLPHNRNRFYFFTVDTATVVVSVEAAPEHFEELVAETERLVSSLDFRQR